MKTLIVTGGEHPSRKFLRFLASGSDLLIAADSGFDTAHGAGLVPDYVVGDFDSIKDPSLIDAVSGDRVVEYPADKDDTDTEIALRLAFSKGSNHVAIAGAGGGRLDHLFAMLSLFKRKEHPHEWHTRRESLYFLDARRSGRFEMPLGSIVSVFPLSDECSGMSSRGLKWPLEGLGWGKGQFGISNRSVAPAVSVSAGSSSLAVIVPCGSKCLFE